MILPRTREQSENSRRATEYGTLVHHWKETGETDPDWADPKDTDLLERKILAVRGERLRRRLWPEDEGLHEVSYALHLRKLELKRFKGARPDADTWKKTFGPEWLTGTIDWLSTTARWVDDLKTGRWPVAPTTRQITSYSLFPYIEEGRRPDWRSMRSITQWPKYPIDKPPVRKWGPQMTALELEEHLDDLRWALDNPTEMNPGEEVCRFCDSQDVCPQYGL